MVAPDVLTAAGCERIFQEKASGAQRDRPELAAALDYVRKGDTLVASKLDRLARSMKQLIETVERMEARKVGFRDGAYAGGEPRSGATQPSKPECPSTAVMGFALALPEASGRAGGPAGEITDRGAPAARSTS